MPSFSAYKEMGINIFSKYFTHYILSSTSHQFVKAHLREISSALCSIFQCCTHLFLPAHQMILPMSTRLWVLISPSYPMLLLAWDRWEFRRCRFWVTTFSTSGKFCNKICDACCVDLIVVDKELLLTSCIWQIPSSSFGINSPPIDSKTITAPAQTSVQMLQQYF